MFRFIRIWLLMRTLKCQEEHVINLTPNAKDLYTQGAYPLVPKNAFVIDATGMNIWLAFLPRFLQKGLLPRRQSEPSRKFRNKLLKDRDSLLRRAYAKKYLEGKSDTDYNQQTNELPDKIRTSPEGDDFATYMGGFNALLKEYPQAWSFLVVALSPSWIPWLIKHAASLL